MRGHQLMLTLQPALHAAVKKAADKRLMTIQEYIASAIRDSLSKHGKPGPKRKPAMEDLYTR